MYKDYISNLYLYTIFCLCMCDFYVLTVFLSGLRLNRKRPSASTHFYGNQIPILFTGDRRKIQSVSASILNGRTLSLCRAINMWIRKEMLLKFRFFLLSNKSKIPERIRLGRLYKYKSRKSIEIYSVDVTFSECKRNDGELQFSKIIPIKTY